MKKSRKLFSTHKLIVKTSSGTKKSWNTEMLLRGLRFIAMYLFSGINYFSITVTSDLFPIASKEYVSRSSCLPLQPTGKTVQSLFSKRHKFYIVVKWVTDVIVNKSKEKQFYC